MRTIALLLLFALPLSAQERLTVDDIRAAVPGAPAEFVLAEYDAKPMTAEQVKMAWLMEQRVKPESSINWTELITAVITILTILSTYLHNRYSPPPPTPSDVSRVADTVVAKLAEPVRA